jgi:glutathione synthase
MMWAAMRRGHTLGYVLQSDLFINNGKAFGLIKPLDVFENTKDFFKLGETVRESLADYDVILMRKDPPFDMNFVYTTYILEQAEREGAWVVNRPQSLRDCNEKLFATQFPELMVPTLVTSQQSLIREFLAEHGDIIVKPLDGMGGSGIFRLQTGGPNVGSTLEMLTNLGQLPIMAQKYIPAIVDGDKRILMINGEPVPYCLARIPQNGEVRGNLAAGGRGEARPLTEKDRAIAAKVGSVLREKGLVFVGLDVIGEYVTEINVTSPTCVREIDAQFGTSIADDLFEVLEAGRGTINSGNCVANSFSLQSRKLCGRLTTHAPSRSACSRI